MPHVPHIMTFIEQIAEDQEHPDAVVGATCGLIGLVLSRLSVCVLLQFWQLLYSCLFMGVISCVMVIIDIFVALVIIVARVI